MEIYGTGPLLPCPFCGGEAVAQSTPTGSGHGESYDKISVSCRSCKAEIGEGSYAGHEVARRTRTVVEKWNRRV